MSSKDELSLDAPESPEQLDRYIHITSSSAWMAVGLLLIMVICIVTWSFIGRLPENIQGLGFITPSTRDIFKISSNDAGVITRTAVAEGDSVQKGQLLFVLKRPDIKLQQQNAEEKLTTLIEQQKRRKKAADDAITNRQQLANNHINNYRKEIKASSKHRDFLIKELKEQVKLIKKGYVTKSHVEDLRTQLSDTKAKLATYKSDIEQERNNVETFANTKQSELEDMTRQIEAAQAKFEELKLKSLVGHIYSPASGLILEISTQLGKLEDAGAQLALLEHSEGIYIVRAYVPMSKGLRVKADMPVEVALVSVQPEIYGTLKGIVHKVSIEPQSKASIANLFQNEAIVNMIMQDGPPFKVEVALIKSTSTVSGYQWSTANGPPMRLSDGTLANIKIISAYHHPIDYLLPIFSNISSNAIESNNNSNSINSKRGNH